LRIHVAHITSSSLQNDIAKLSFSFILELEVAVRISTMLVSNRVGSWGMCSANCTQVYFHAATELSSCLIEAHTPSFKDGEFGISSKSSLEVLMLGAGSYNLDSNHKIRVPALSTEIQDKKLQNL
jgi:hypothetical protein